MSNSVDARPLVLLDVDGVLHDRAMRDRIRMSDDPDGLAASLQVRWVAAGGVRIAIPDDVAALVRRLTESAEVWWCTTWGERANTYLAPAIGIGSLPVVGAHARGVGLAWKVEHARPVIDEALARRRRVVWIEDFDGVFPDLGGVEFIDTAAKGLIGPDDLPAGLLS